MRHAQVEQWSLGTSVLHRRHAGAKILSALTLLVAIATLTDRALAVCVLYFALLIAGALAARIPPLAMLRAATVVLPFAFCFGLASALTGDPARGFMLLVRGYLSALVVFLLIGTTAMPDLIKGLEWLRLPRFLLQVMQFLYRYLMVLREEAGAMRQASLARAGSIRTFQFRHASAAAAVLFARAWTRALSIHQAMVSRGFEGSLPAFRRLRFGTPDAGFAVGVAAIVIGLRAILR